jgi:GTP-binding protein EngB required for normal cell division
MSEKDAPTSERGQRSSPGEARDLSEYAQIKLELADIVRFAGAKAPRDGGLPAREYRDFFARLADDRFNLTLVGRFNRGKTSLMNALLGSDRLPTGIVPLTSVITSVSYGSAEHVHLEFARGGLPFEIRMDELADYITERGNPGNRRGVREARIRLPAEILRHGYYFVDTPGLGSAIAENTRTSLSFLPETDALVLVSGYESPLSEEEVRVLEAMARRRTQVFVVLNKQDSVEPRSREEVLAFVKRRLETLFGDASPAVFSTSATGALQAMLAHRPAELAQSGLPALERALTGYLIAHKSDQFLRRMLESAGELLSALPPDAGVEALKGRLRRIELPEKAPREQESTVRSHTPAAPVQRCELCERINDRFFEFLCQFQHRVVTDGQSLERFTASHGFCARHLWLYAALAAPRDLCVALAPVLRSWSKELREPRREGEKALPPIQCQMCAIQERLESETIIRVAAERLPGVSEFPMAPSLCIPHLRMVADALPDPALVRALCAEHARSFDRLAEDMQRYALKHDALRRYLTNEEERRADDDAMHRLAGRRLINS